MTIPRSAAIPCVRAMSTRSQSMSSPTVERPVLTIAMTLPLPHAPSRALTPPLRVVPQPSWRLWPTPPTMPPIAARRRLRTPLPRRLLRPANRAQLRRLLSPTPLPMSPWLSTRRPLPLAELPKARFGALRPKCRPRRRRRTTPSSPACPSFPMPRVWISPIWTSLLPSLRLSTPRIAWIPTVSRCLS